MRFRVSLAPSSLWIRVFCLKVGNYKKSCDFFIDGFNLIIQYPLIEIIINTNG